MWRNSDYHSFPIRVKVLWGVRADYCFWEPWVASVAWVVYLYSEMMHYAVAPDVGYTASDCYWAEAEQSAHVA